MGIRIKLLTPYLITLVLMYLAIHFLWVPELVDKEKQKSIEKEKQVLKALEPILIRDILARDFGSFYMTLNQTLESSPGWVYLVVENSSGKKLYPLSSPEIPSQKELLNIEEELILGGEVIGRAHLIVDWKQEKVQIYSYAKDIETLILLLFGVTLLIGAIWQTISIQKPILSLEKIANKIALGNFETEIPAGSSDELGALFKAFSVMRDNLVSSQNKLKNSLNISKEANIEIGKAKKGLLKSQIQLKAIIENVIDGIIVINERGIIESINPAGETMFGVCCDEIIGRNVKELMPEPYKSEHDAYLKNYIDEGNSKIIGVGRELLGLKQDGTEFPIHLTIAEIWVGQERKFVGLTTDLTEQKKAQKTIKKQMEQSRFLASIVENTDQAIIGKDLNGKIVSWNKGAENIYGHKANEIVGSDITRIFPQDRLSDKKVILAKILQGVKVENFETVRIKKDGTLINVSLTISPIKNEANEIVGASSVATDISRRKKLEKILQANERFTRKILTDSFEAIITINCQGEVLSWNKKAEDLFGYCESDVSGKNISELIIPERYREDHIKGLKVFNETGYSKF